MRQRRWTGQPDTFTPNLTPLLDVVLQLITFFMMLIHFGTKIEGASEWIKLPIIPSALPHGDLAIDRLIVSINSDGNLLGDKAVLNKERMMQWWADQAKLRRQGMDAVGNSGTELKTIVIVRADKKASYGAVRSILEGAQKQGFAFFSLIVLRSDTP